MAPPVDRRVQVPPNCDLTLGMVCLDKREPGRTVWRMVADERFANPAGVIQGGFLGALADSAMGASSLTYAKKRKVFSANAELKVSFLKPVPVGSVLTCTAQVISGGSPRRLRRSRGGRRRRTSGGEGLLDLSPDPARGLTCFAGQLLWLSSSWRACARPSSSGQRRRRTVQAPRPPARPHPC